MIIYAVVFDDNRKELTGRDDGLSVDETVANKARDNWNSDVGGSETRLAAVVPMVVN